MDLDSAIQKHMDWKVTFRTAISKQEQMDVHLFPAYPAKSGLSHYAPYKKKSANKEKMKA